MEPPFQPHARRLSASTHPGALALVVTLMALLCTSCAGFSSSSEAPLNDAERLQKITSLEASIARDRAALADLVTRPRNIETDPLHDDEKLRELADRLTRDTEALGRMKAELGAGETDS